MTNDPTKQNLKRGPRPMAGSYGSTFINPKKEAGQAEQIKAIVARNKKVLEEEEAEDLEDILEGL